MGKSSRAGKRITHGEAADMWEWSDETGVKLVRIGSIRNADLKLRFRSWLCGQTMPLVTDAGSYSPTGFAFWWDWENFMGQISRGVKDPVVSD